VNAVVAVFSVAGSAALASGRPVPEWDYARLASAMAILNVVTGFTAALLHMGAHRSVVEALVLLGLCTVIAGGSELAGTLTGVPFGSYEYTGKLGPRFLGAVPYLIPLAWFTMMHASISVARTLSVPGWTACVFSAGMVTVWDVALDPAMTARFPAWVWSSGGGFYGIPFSNYLTWFVLAALIAGLGLRWSPQRSLDSPRLPWALYLLQSIFPAALAAVYGRGWATVAWAVGFAAIVTGWMVLRRRPGAREPSAPEDIAGVRP
jgi:putative membrane protein